MVIKNLLKRNWRMLEQIAVISLWLAAAYMILAFKLGVFGL